MNDFNALVMDFIAHLNYRLEVFITSSEHTILPEKQNDKIKPTGLSSIKNSARRPGKLSSRSVPRGSFIPPFSFGTSVLRQVSMMQL